jgi:hypothetical protein
MLLLIISITFYSCKKDKFELGIYEMTLTWTETVDNESKNFESTRLLNIISESEHHIEIEDYGESSLFLTKKRNKISGDLPVTSNFTSIEGKKSPFSSNITGTFETTKYVTQGPSGAPYLIFSYSGKFKMKRQ